MAKQLKQSKFDKLNGFTEKDLYCKKCGTALQWIEYTRSYDTEEGDVVIHYERRCPVRMFPLVNFGPFNCLTPEEEKKPK